MYWLYLFTAIAVLISFIADRDRTVMAGLTAVRKIIRIAPAIFMMLILVSVALYLVPERVISHYLVDRNTAIGMAIASLFGSITFMPGFIAFPLSGILLQKGVPYMVLSALTTTMMMVGVVTYPIEREYLGRKVTILRNIIGLVIALIVAVVTGMFYGEVGL